MLALLIFFLSVSYSYAAEKPCPFPSLSGTEQAEGNFRGGDEYFDLYNRFILDYPPHQKLRQRAIESLPQNGKSFIDAAGGTGILAHQIEQALPGSKALVLDKSPDMLALAKNKGLTVHTSDLTELKFQDGTLIPNNSIDGYVSLSAYYFLNRNETTLALTRAKEVVRPDGTIIIASLRPLNPIDKLNVNLKGIPQLIRLWKKGTLSWGELKKVISTVKSHIKQTHSMTASEMASIGQELGLEVVEADNNAYLGLYYYVVFRVKE